MKQNTEIEESPIRIENTREYLRYDFTVEELQEFARTMARKHQERQRLEQEKQAVTAQFKSNIEAAESVISDCSRSIANGYEYRNIDCELRFNDPKVGMKTLIRTDSGEVVKTAPMSAAEMQEPLPFQG